MEKIKRFIECLVPDYSCNLKCNYCYIVQRKQRGNKASDFQYSPEVIGEALSQNRMGGICYFSICGAGETLVPAKVIDIAYNILKQGHFVNITTNGTLTKRFDEILKFPKEYLERLHFSFSFHYLELLPNKLDIFFDNVNRVRKGGCSILVQVNLCDEYLPYLDEIKYICEQRTGGAPQIVATRKETELHSNIELFTEHSKEEYQSFGGKFHSPLFDFTMNNFGLKRKGFCYAGDWSATLNLATGAMGKCYSSYIVEDIFKYPTKPINFTAVGDNCKSLFCMNASHFMSLGVIPSIEVPTYASLRNREDAGWYSNRMSSFLNGKLENNNTFYSKTQIIKTNMMSIVDRAFLLKALAGGFRRKLWAFIGARGGR